MQPEQLSESDGPWARALRDAADTPTLEDALAAVLAPLVPVTGARAAAFVERHPPRVLAAWHCEPADVLPLLRCVDELVQTSWSRDEPLVIDLEAPPTCGIDVSPGGLVVVYPLPSLDAGMAVLLLYYEPQATPTLVQRQRGAGLAALGCLIREREELSEEASRARDARSHFLVAMHHELRTPATAVMLEAGLLRSGLLGTLPPRLEGSLSRLEAQIGELVRVVRRVLDLAQLEASAEPPRLDLVDPRPMIVEVARRVEPAAQRKEIALSLFFPRVLPVLQTDAERFRRVLLYLLANALKYTQAGRVQVRVERVVRRVGAVGREPLLVVRVIDTGPGIPPEERERIFEPFAQVEEGARTDSNTRGVGLGLPLARKLARSLGGEVEVESEPGRGTTATFSLPYRQPTAEV